MNPRTKKFIAYYRPYRRLLAVDLGCALIVSAITLILPLCTRYITKDLLANNATSTVGQMVLIGLLMLFLVGIHTLCSMFVAYQGHVMGASIESDMRRELFSHYQKLSFSFFDQEKTGQLMTRITNDTFALGELYHHGPEDLLISTLNFFGATLVLLSVNVGLTVLVLAFLPVMAIYAVHFNRKMRRALRSSRDRVGDINAQVEETLAGIRVVKSFGHEAFEDQQFAYQN